LIEYHSADRIQFVVQFELFSADYVHRLTAGDPETEQHFVLYFSELILIKIRRLVRTPQALEDIRQETFLRVFRVLRQKGLTAPERLGAFVNGVCRNVMVEYFRSLARHPQLPEEAIEAPCGGPGPEAELVTEERKRIIRRVLADMPEKDRDILRMVFLEEHDKDDVCRIYNVDRNHLRVLLHRAKNRFRDRLAEPAEVVHGVALV
jgi:RNA polymerase sigma-70 factor, ECF subfamily